MNDKFSIINNNIINENDVIEIINSLLYSNKIIVVPSIINSLLYDEAIINNTITEIKKYILSIKKNIKNSIKKGTLSFENLNNQINEIIFKISYIDKLSNNSIYKNIISDIPKHLINDTIISLFLEKQFCNLDISNKLNIFELFKIVISISFYDKKKSFNKLLNNISNSIIDKKFDKIEDILVFIDNINSYYDFLIITDIVTITKNLINLIISKLIESAFKINDIIDVFNNNEKLYSYIIYNDDIYKLCAELITGLNNNTFHENNCYLLINILNIINDIFINIDINDKLNENEYKLCNNRILILLLNNMDNIHKYIDNLIRKMINDNSLDYYNTISSIIDIINNGKISKYNSDKLIIKSKNDYLIKFIENYNDFLVKRLLTISHKNINIELNIINNIINKKFDKISRYNTNKIINSFKDNYNLLKHELFHPSIMPYGLLNINHNNYIDKTDINNSLLIDYYNSYSTVNKDKTLCWFPQYGEVNITYDNNNFIMLPIHFMILELFDKSENIKIKDIYTLAFLKNYEKSLIDKLVESLIKSNIVVISSTDNNLLLNKSKNYNTNIIEIFNNIKNPVEYNINYVIPKKDIICSNINHILKQTDANKEELFKYLQDTIIVFKLVREDFDSAIQYMINMDYIASDGNIYSKLY